MGASEAEEAKPKRAKRKRGRGRLVALVLVPLLALAGGGGGFAFVRGLGPFGRRKPPPRTAAPKVAVKRTPKPPEKAPSAPAAPAPRPTTRTDPDAGAARLAKLWNEVEGTKLLAIAKDWKDPALARVAARMEPEKVAEILALLPPKRASALSKEMQRLGSVVPAD